MTQIIEVKTFFDCTPTGVVSHRRNHSITEEQWHFQRNQQRNWETLLQCISLRCQALNLQEPQWVEGTYEQATVKVWYFSFETDRDEIFADGNDPVGLLKADCHGVPMLVGLAESERELFLTPYLITSGDGCNIFFNLLSDK